LLVYPREELCYRLIKSSGIRIEQVDGPADGDAQWGASHAFLHRSCLSDSFAGSIGVWQYGIAGHTPAPTIKIGSFLSVSGSASLLGEPEQKTLQLYIDHLNTEGGVLGKELLWFHYDVGDDAQRAQTAVKRLLEVDKIDLIIGGSTTGTTLAVIPLIEAAGIPFISLAGSVKITEPVKRWVFKIPPTDRMAAAKIFTDMQQRGISKIALLCGSEGFGASGRQEAKALTGEYGIAIAADETYSQRDTDVQAQLNQIVATPGVQAVINFGTGQELPPVGLLNASDSYVQAVLNFGAGQGPVTVTKSYRQLKLPWPLYLSHGVASPQYIERAGSAAEGVRLPGGLLLVVDQLPDNHPQKPILLHYRNAYEWRYGEPVSSFGGYAYDALMLAVEAIQRAGTTDKEKVRTTLEETRGYIGVTGVFNLSSSDHLGLDKEALHMLEVCNGAFTLSD
jgi:branched-chain amino acid transport system substrate-binding protein